MYYAWAGFERTTLVVIGTNCVDSCKSNYHTITTTTTPFSEYENVHRRNIVVKCVEHSTTHCQYDMNVSISNRIKGETIKLNTNNCYLVNTHIQWFVLKAKNMLKIKNHDNHFDNYETWKVTRKIRVMNGKSLTNYTLSKKQTPVTHLVKSGGCKFIRNLTRSQIKKTT